MFLVFSRFGVTLIWLYRSQNTRSVLRMHSYAMQRGPERDAHSRSYKSYKEMAFPDT